MKSFLVSKTVEAEGLYDSDPFATGRIKMKKHRFIVLALVFMLLFAAVSCNQEPEIKADPLDETKQAIPAENVDMTSALVITPESEQATAFGRDWASAYSQVSNGIVGKALSGEIEDFTDALNAYFGFPIVPPASKPTNYGEIGGIEVTSMSGVVSATATKVDVEVTEEDTTTVVENIAIDNVSATATVLKKDEIDVVVNGTIEGKVFSISLKLDSKMEVTNTDVSGNPDALIALGKIMDEKNSYEIMGIQGLKVELKGIGLGVKVSVIGLNVPVSASASIEGAVSVEYSENMQSLETSNLKISLNVEQIANVNVAIKDLSIKGEQTPSSTGGEPDNVVTIAVSEVSLSGTLLPLKDNIRLKANMRDLSFKAKQLGIESIEASIAGYNGAISIAASIENLDVDTSIDEPSPAFKFGAAATIGNQTIGVRGDLSSSNPLEITMLNGNPVTQDSLRTLIMRCIIPPSGTV